MDSTTDQNTVTLSHAVELACKIIMSAGGEDASNRLDGQRATQSDIKRAVTAKMQSRLDRPTGGQ